MMQERERLQERDRLHEGKRFGSVGTAMGWVPDMFFLGIEVVAGGFGSVRPQT